MLIFYCQKQLSIRGKSVLENATSECLWKILYIPCCASE